MSVITIDYADFASGGAGLNVLRASGLKAYFTHYASTFYAPGYPVPPTPPVGTPPAATTTQWFSTRTNVSPDLNNTPPTSFNALYADLQYAGAATRPADSQKSVFIAEVKHATSGGVKIVDTSLHVGQLTYDYANHAIFGELDNIYLGDNIYRDDTHAQQDPVPNFMMSPSGANITFETGAAGVVDIKGLAAVLNAGYRWNATASKWEVIPWASGDNDVHNILYPLMGQHGGYGTASGLVNLFNTDVHRGNDIVLEHKGSIYGEVFDGFNNQDVFKVAGGHDKINSFVAADDTVNLGGLYGYATAALAYAAVDNIGGNAVLESASGLHSVTFVGVLKASLSASDFVL